MPALGRYRSGSAAALLIGLLAASPSLAGAMPVASEPPPLSITIANGRDAADRGDRLRYTVTVFNGGPVDLQDVVITQSVPTGASFVSADGRGKRTGQVVTWQLDLVAAKSSRIHSAMVVGTPPDKQPRLASKVCVRLTSTAVPIVCDVDADLLPAGAAAEVAAATVDPMTWPEVLRSAGPGLGGGALLVAAVGALLVLGRRRGMRSRPAAWR